MGIEDDARLAKLASAYTLFMVTTFHYFLLHYLYIEIKACGLAVSCRVGIDTLASVTCAVTSTLVMDVVV